MSRRAARFPAAARALRWAALALAMMLVAPLPARAQQVVADLSSHLVAITTGFVGTDVLLFGAVDGEGDIIVVVRGPDRPQVVRRKERVAGVWINADRLTFANAPAFYALASSKPVAQLLAPSALVRHRIGLDNLELRPEGIADAARVAAFRAGLIRNKTRAGLYDSEVGHVAFLGNRLFRTNIYFPATVPTGTYIVDIFLVREGVVVSAQTTPLLISKIGIGAEIFRFAHQSSILYGVIAILMALFAGWLAGVVFRKA